MKHMTCLCIYCRWTIERDWKREEVEGSYKERREYEDEIFKIKIKDRNPNGIKESLIIVAGFTIHLPSLIHSFPRY